MGSREQQEKIVGHSRRRRLAWLLVLGGVALAAVLLWAPPNGNDRGEGDGIGVTVAAAGQRAPHSDIGGPHSNELQAVGTSGSHDEVVGAEDAAVVREIETITGTNDAMSLVGRRVDLHVDVQEHANDHAFWVGSRDNRLLVVWGRDHRDGSKVQAGVPAGNGVDWGQGRRAAIAGVVRSIPIQENRNAWGLTDEHERELHDRKIYIHAQSVMPEGE